jgi:glyoxylate reductase
MTMFTRIDRPKLAVTRKLVASVEARMSELFDVDLNADDAPMSKEQLVCAVQSVDVLVPTVTDQIDSEVISAAGPRLKLIANYGAGVNNIDLKAAKARDIIVTNTPGVFTNDTADLTLALMLAVPRRISEGRRLLEQGGWTGWSPTGMLGHSLNGKMLGIIGFGRIGEAVARRAQAFGMKVIYNKRHRLPPSVEGELGVVFEPEIDRLVAAADFISLHCPLTETTESIIDADRLAMMKADCYLINTSRGGLVDEMALIDALRMGRIAGAGLDVYAQEPHLPEGLLELPNVVALPHMGSGTIEGRTAAGEKVIANIRVWSDGHRPPNQILEGWG